ncbi:MAG: glycosyltransferase family 4 protein [Alsobacter sp.]
MPPDVVFAIPGDLATPTGGYGYDRELMAHLPEHGLSVEHLQLPGSFPMASVPDLGETGYKLSQTSPNSVILVDGLAYGAMTDIVLKDMDRTFVALVHHPLAHETGLSDRMRRALAASEKSALKRAAHVVVTSPATARTLVGEFDVPSEKLTVALPGTDPAPRSAGSPDGTTLLCVGTVSPRKAYDVLARALGGLKDLTWTCRIAGETDRVAGEFDRVRAVIDEEGLAGRIAFIGVLDRPALDRAYACADIFLMPSLYEGYGMALAEAMARGLPIVCTTGGAAAETVPDGAGLKVPPGDAPALRHAIRVLLEDPARRRALSDGSWAAGRSLPTWSHTAGVVAETLKRVQAGMGGRT